jgi:hypothetical protein
MKHRTDRSSLGRRVLAPMSGAVLAVLLLAPAGAGAVLVQDKPSSSVPGPWLLLLTALCTVLGMTVPRLIRRIVRAYRYYSQPPPDEAAPGTSASQDSSSPERP